MPDKKLDKKTLESFKKLLIDLKSQILGDIKNMFDENRGDQGDKGDISGHALHMADVATDMYDREFNLSLASNDRGLLKRIEDALKRIEEKTYGFCLESGKKIPEARLQALPYAEYCLEIQEEIDSGKRHV